MAVKLGSFTATNRDMLEMWGERDGQHLSFLIEVPGLKGRGKILVSFGSSKQLTNSKNMNSRKKNQEAAWFHQQYEKSVSS